MFFIEICASRLVIMFVRNLFIINVEYWHNMMTFTDYDLAIEAFYGA